MRSKMQHASSFCLLLLAASSLAQRRSMHILSEIHSKFAVTNVGSEVDNAASVAREETFSVLLPDKAFITNLTLYAVFSSYCWWISDEEVEAGGIEGMNERWSGLEWWVSRILALGLSSLLTLRLRYALLAWGFFPHGLGEVGGLLSFPGPVCTQCAAVAAALHALAVVLAYGLPLPVLACLFVAMLALCPLRGEEGAGPNINRPLIAMGANGEDEQRLVVLAFPAANAEEAAQMRALILAGIQLVAARLEREEEVGIAPALLASLPLFIYRAERDGAVDPCPICMEEPGSVLQLVRLPCSHVLHAWPCAAAWLASHNRCPLCTLHIQLPAPYQPY